MPQAIVTLQEIKNHLRITGASEDALLSLYAEAAREKILNFLNTVVIEGESDSPLAVPFAIKAAMLLIIGDLYENREAQSEKPLQENKTVMDLLYPLRVDIGL